MFCWKGRGGWIGKLPNAVVNWGEMGKSCGKRKAFSMVFAHGA